MALRKWLKSLMPGRVHQQRRKERRHVVSETLEVRWVLSAAVPTAVNDAYKFDSLIRTDRFDPEWNRVHLDVLSNDKAKSGPLDFSSLKITRGPAHGTAIVRQEWYDDSSYKKLLGFNGLVNNNGSPVGDGHASAVSGTVDQYGQIKLAVSTPLNRFVWGLSKLEEEGDYALFVRLGVSDFSAFAGNVYDYSFRDRLVAPVDMPILTEEEKQQNSWFHEHRIESLKPGTPYIAWIDNTVGDGTPDTVLQKVGPWGIRYEPAPGFVGTDTIRYTVRDRHGRVSKEATVSVTINNRSPVAEATQMVVAKQTSAEIIGKARDPDGSIAPGSLKIVSNPKYGRVESRTNTDAGGRETTYLVYVPLPGWFGTDPHVYTDRLSYTVTDDKGAVSQPATITILVQNTAPLLVDDVAVAARNASVLVDVLSNDLDPDGFLKENSLAIAAAPRFGKAVVVASGSGPVIRYTPQRGFLGTDTFQYYVKDESGARSIATVIINPAPLAGEDRATTAENTPIVVNVLANDAAALENLNLKHQSLTLATGPRRGTVAFQSTSSGWKAVYTPQRGTAESLMVDDPSDRDDGKYSKGRLSLREAIRLANSDRYTDTFTYTVRDEHGIASAPATVRIDVLPGATRIQFAPGLLAAPGRRVNIQQIGDSSEGNSALAIQSPISIIGPNHGPVLTLAAAGTQADLRHFLVTTNGSLTLQNMRLTRGGSDSDGGAIAVLAGGRATLVNCVLDGNLAVGKGGAIYNFGTVTLTDSQIKRNQARQGGGISNFGLLTVTRTAFLSNRAEVGGAVDLELGTVTMTGGSFRGNSASQTGGAVFNASSLTINGTSFDSNEAEEGGALWNVGNAGLFDCRISGNQAVTGGGLMNGSITPALNPATEQSGTLSLTRTSLLQNQADRGGAVFNRGDFTMEAGQVAGNIAEEGGGLYNDDFGLRPQGASRLNLRLVTVRDNRATDGAGLYNSLGGVTIVGSTFVSNAASHSGGALLNNAFAALQNTTIGRNSATYSGGGIYNGTGSLQIISSTIASNSSLNGGGLYNDVGYVSLTSSLVADNRSGKKASDLEGRTPVNVMGSTHNLIGRGGSGGLIDGEQNNLVGAVPFLAALANYGGSVPTFALLPGSPAIDAGTDDGKDARGVSPAGPRDIGAFESRGFTLSVRSGSRQAARVNRPFGKPLQVQVVAKNRSEPVTGGQVIFAGPTVGAAARLQRIPAAINARGIAEVNATANNVAGTYNVEASTFGTTANAGFRLTNTGATVPGATTSHSGNTTGTALRPEVVSSTKGTGTSASNGSSGGMMNTPQQSSASARSASTAAALDWSKGYATFPADTTQYRLNDRGQLRRQLPGKGWTILAEDVVHFEKAQNGDVYLLNTQFELKRLQLGHYWTTLQTGVRTFEMSPAGQVFVLDHLHRFSTYASLAGYYILPASSTTPMALDPPSDGEVVEAARIAKAGFNVTVLTGELQSFSLGATFPLQAELDAILSASGRGQSGNHAPRGSSSPVAPRKWYAKVRIVVEKIRDSVEAPREFSGVGWAELHHAEYKATIYGNYRGIDGDSINGQLVVFICHDHLHRVGTNSLPRQDEKQTTSMLFGPSLVTLPETYRTVDRVKGTGLHESFAPRIAKGVDGTIYKMGIIEAGTMNVSGGVNSDPAPYNLARLTPNGVWEGLQEVRAMEVAPDGTLYALSVSHELQSLRPETRHWVTLQRNVQSFAMRPDGTLVALNADQQLQQWNGARKKWQTLETGVAEFTLLTDGRFYVLNTRQELRQWRSVTRATTVARNVTALAQIDDTLYLLNQRGELRKLTATQNSRVARASVASFTVAFDGTLYALDFTGQLQRMNPKGQMEWLHNDVQSLQVAPNGHLYLLTNRRELKRLKFGYSWSTLQSEVTSFRIDEIGTVFVHDQQNRVTMYSSPYAYFVNEAIDTTLPHFEEDPPSDGRIVHAAAFSGIGGQTLEWPDAVFDDVQYFPEGPDDLQPPRGFNSRDITVSSGATSSNVRMVVDRLSDIVDPPRYFPNIGLIQVHHAQYKATIYSSTLVAHPSSSPDNIYVNEEEIQVLFIDMDRLHQYIPGTIQQLPEGFGILPESPGLRSGLVVKRQQSTGTTAPTQQPRSAAIVRSASSTDSNRAPQAESVQRRRDELAQSLTTAPDGTIYKLGGGQTGMIATGSEPGPHFLWRLPPRQGWQPIDYVYSFALASDSRLFFVDKEHVLRTPAQGPVEYSDLAHDVQEFFIDTADTLWILNSVGELRTRAAGSTQWSAAQPGYRSLMKTPSGAIVVLSASGELKEWSPGRRWHVIDRNIQASAMLDDGALYFLNSRGQLKRKQEFQRVKNLAVRVTSFQVAPDGGVYALNDRGELQKLTVRDHWTVLDRGVGSFQFAPNGDLYLITPQQELRRLKAGFSWTTLKTGVQSMDITSDGTVTVLDTQQRKTLYSSLGPYFVLPAAPDNARDLLPVDAPSDGAILAAANLISPAQTFENGPLDPFAHERAELLASEGITDMIPFGGLAGTSLTLSKPTPALRSTTTSYKIPTQRTVSHVTIVTKKIVDQFQAPQFMPSLGVVQPHRVQFRSTIHFTNKKGEREELIVWMDHDHFHYVESNRHL